MHHVIIGNGIAGVQAAEAIRSVDARSELTIVAAETFPPYSRPMISLLLEGLVTPDRLPIRSDDAFEHKGIRLLKGRRVESIDPSNRQIHLDDGTHLSFDRLLVATGASPRNIRAEGTHLKHIFTMRTVDDVLGMTEALRSCRRALVLGGGLVGFKAAYALLKRGIPVTMLISSGYPLAMQIDAVAGNIVRETLIRHGLTVETGVDVSAFEGNGVVQRAILNDGRVVDCDLVVIGKGVRPATAFLKGTGITLDLGIPVDDHLQTNLPGVFAAGDVAQSYDIVRKRLWINAIWPEAATQGWIAGLNMAGRPVRYPGSLGRNVIRMFDLDIMTAGIVRTEEAADARVIEVIDQRTPIYRKFVLKDGRLIGFTLINRIENGGRLVSLIQRGLPLDGEEERLLMQ
ncbi:MAG: FAD-dependent oxidoreductase [Thermodesulfobacteriota bacterium]